ncbi:putative competence-damage inducible protein [compost metagenome]
MAGPDSSEGKPPGLVYIGLAKRDGTVEVTENRLGGSREIVKLRAAKQALYMLWRQLVSRE